VSSGLRDADGFQFGVPKFALRYQWQRNELGGNGWIDISFATQESYVLGDADVGYAIRVKVYYVDYGGTTETAYSVGVGYVIKNFEPAISSAIADQASAEEKGWNYQVPAGTFSDGNGDQLTYSATLANGDALPNWLLFDATTRTFSGTPPLDFNGNVSIKVTASDGSASASDTFVLTVTALNDAPVFASASQTVSATAGTAKTITLVATDVDGDALTYTVATPGKGTASISGSTLTYTPG
jgi:hypothetical protein